MIASSFLRGEELLVVELDRFQGPLDLLLHLIRQQDIDIFDIPIAHITKQFLKAIEGISAEDLDSAGEFLEMAASLLRIKAQMLLPRGESEEGEDPRAELVRRLLEYEQIREITQRLESSEADRGRRFRKGYLPIRPTSPLEEVPLETTWEEVYAAALKVELPDPHSREHNVMRRSLVSMEEKLELILASVRDVAGVEFRKLLSPFQEKMHGVMTFLAGLELARRRQVLLRQTGPFHDLWIYFRKEDDEDATSVTEEGEGES